MNDPNILLDFGDKSQTPSLTITLGDLSVTLGFPDALDLLDRLVDALLEADSSNQDIQRMSNDRHSLHLWWNTRQKQIAIGSIRTEANN